MPLQTDDTTGNMLPKLVSNNDGIKGAASLSLTQQKYQVNTTFSQTK